MCANFAHVLCSSNSPSLNTSRSALSHLQGKYRVRQLKRTELASELEALNASALPTN